MQNRRSSRILILSLLGLVTATGAKSLGYEPKLPNLASSQAMNNTAEFKIQEKLGTNIDMNLAVTDEEGNSRTLKDYFKSGHPVILSLVYYSCPSLCNFHLNGLFDTFKAVDWKAGDKFTFIALSFDAKETAEVAAAKRRNYLQLLGEPKSEKGIHFLTASQPTISAVASTVGFNYKWDEANKQWAHSSAAIVISPKGEITRYLHGIQFSEKDFKLALSDATQGKIGTFVDQMIWYCFMYDPKVSKYTIYAFRLVQIAGALVVILLSIWLLPIWLRQKAAARAQR